MAGHSKWANIKHKKALVDAKRGKTFTKLIRELVVAAKSGPNPADNPRLRAAVDKALSSNMKRDTIDKAIIRGSGAGEGENYEEVTYEGYGPNGIAVLVECLTDNRNRSVAEVRHAFSKRGGNLGVDGSVAYMFNNIGQIVFEAGADEEAIMEAALDAGADDVINHDDGNIEVVTSFELFLSVKDALISAGLEPVFAETAKVADTQIELSEENAEKIAGLVDMLEELDDVQNVYTNCA